MSILSKLSQATKDDYLIIAIKFLTDLFLDAEWVGAILHAIYNFHAVSRSSILDDQGTLIVRPSLLPKLIAPAECVSLSHYPLITLAFYLPDLLETFGRHHVSGSLPLPKPIAEAHLISLSLSRLAFFVLIGQGTKASGRGESTD